MPEGKKLAEDRTREIEAMSLDELIRFVDDPVTTDLTGSSGRTYRCRMFAFWDMEPWQSELMVEVTVKGRGRAFLQRYAGIDVRMPDEGAEDRPAEHDPHVTSTFVLALTKAGCLTGAVGVLVALIGGFAYAVSRLARWL